MNAGGLNYQIEHHLFPTLPRHNLRKVAAAVQALCEKHGLVYEHCGFASGESAHARPQDSALPRWKSCSVHAHGASQYAFIRTLCLFPELSCILYYQARARCCSGSRALPPPHVTCRCRRQLLPDEVSLAECCQQ